MGLQGFANRMEARYAPQLQRMFGQDMRGVGVSFGDTHGHWGYNTGRSGSMQFDQNIWRTLSGAQRRGLFIHELSDMAQARAQGLNGPDTRHNDLVSDSAAYALTGVNLGSVGEGAGALQKVVQHRGWDTMARTNPGGNGHPVGSPGNNRPRNRNTVGNGAMAATPSPSQEVNYGAQLAQSQYTYAQAQAAGRMKVAQGRAAMLVANQQARAGEITSMAQNVENQIASGGIASSADAKARSGLLSGLTAAQVQNRSDFTNTRLGVRQANEDAYNTMLQSQWSILADRHAAMMAAQQAAFNNGSTLPGSAPVGINGQPRLGPPSQQPNLYQPAQAQGVGVYSPGAGWRF